MKTAEEYTQYVQNIIKMLEDLKTMQDGHLRGIYGASRRIGLEPSRQRPIHLKPYHSDPKAGDIEKQEGEQMLTRKVIETAQTGWAVPVAHAKRKDKSLRFCVDCRKLNSLTVRDTYPLPRMGKCKEFS